MQLNGTDMGVPVFYKHTPHPIDKNLEPRFDFFAPEESRWMLERYIVGPIADTP